MSAQCAVGVAEMKRTSHPKQALRPLQGSNASIEDADMRFFNSAASGSVQNDIKHATGYS